MTVEARDVALAALYEDDLRRGSVEDLGTLSPKARRLVEGVLRHRTEIDERIETASERWRIARMPAVDRAILRMATYELCFEPATPVGVVIAEAVRLAKAFSTERSGAFVNGVLGRIAHETRSAGSDSVPPD